MTTNSIKLTIDQRYLLARTSAAGENGVLIENRSTAGNALIRKRLAIKTLSRETAEGIRGQAARLYATDAGHDWIISNGVGG